MVSNEADLLYRCVISGVLPSLCCQVPSLTLCHCVALPFVLLPGTLPLPLQCQVHSLTLCCYQVPSLNEWNVTADDILAQLVHQVLQLYRRYQVRLQVLEWYSCYVTLEL